jgi:hypothetical protein
MNDLCKDPAADADTTSTLVLGSSSASTWIRVDCEGSPTWSTHAGGDIGIFPPSLAKLLRGAGDSQKPHPDEDGPNPNEDGPHRSWWSYRPHIDIVAIGPKSEASFFIQYADGTWEGRGLPAGLINELDNHAKQHNNRTIMVKSLALGADAGYMVIFTNSQCVWNRVPVMMHRYLQSRLIHSPSVAPEDVTMGPNGEWFLLYTDGSYRCDGHSNECEQILRTISESYNKVVQVAFGGDSSWIITYE